MMRVFFEERAVRRPGGAFTVPRGKRPRCHEGSECAWGKPDGAKRRLLKPLGDVVLGVEVVDEQADPAGGQHDDGTDDLAHEADRFLEDIDDGEDLVTSDPQMVAMKILGSDLHVPER